MNLTEYLRPETLQSLALSVLLAVLVGLWAKAFIKEWRFRPFVVLVVTLILRLAGLFVAQDLRPPAQQIYNVALVTFAAICLETFGYEAIINALGKAGVGSRSESAQTRQAMDLLQNKGFQVKF
jgi:hypothetical protein